MLMDLRELLAADKPLVAIVAVGGLPILAENGFTTLFGKAVTIAEVRTALVDGFGMGSILPFLNPKKRSLPDLAGMSIERGHLWALHALSLTLGYRLAPVEVRNMFACDARFHLSWVVREVNPDACTFSVAGTLKQWRRMVAHRTNADFSDTQRLWLAQSHRHIAEVFPYIEWSVRAAA